VYLTQPRDIYELQNAIKDKITATPENMVGEAMREPYVTDWNNAGKMVEI
jgi:hypothetical protein